MATDSLIPAAQYLRMSTEHQQYSLQNQAAAIEDYANQHGFRIMRTYFDPGKSALVLRTRRGLRQLLQDVVSGEADYRAVLVYDVSRWGRFQDSDEAAYYEFLCKLAGIPVHYCAEPFGNDGSVMSLLWKTIKRSMAAEYSRELSVKVLAGQKNVYLRGFKGGGGCPGYGLRRMLISADGSVKQLLAPGQRKGLQSDRVILVPGPAEEVACVQEIFRLFLENKYGFSRIAEELNAKGVPYHEQVSWDVDAVRNILTNAKYNGWLTYGKRSRKLHMKEQKMPESQWLRVPHPTARLVDDDIFSAVQRRIASFTINKSNDQLLDELRATLVANERLTSRIIRRTPGVASPASLRYRFGSLMHAYELIGYNVPIVKLVATRKKNQAMRQELMQAVQDTNPAELRICSKGGRTRNWLQLKSGIKISVRVCMQVTTTPTVSAWIFREAKGEARWTALVALMNRENTQFEQLLVFPSIPQAIRYVPAKSSWLRGGIQLADLQNFCGIVRMVHSSRRPRTHLLG